VGVQETIRNRPRWVWVACLICACLAPAQQAPSERESIPTFGTTVVVSSGLRGDIYFIPVDTVRLPDFKHLKSVGAIYTTNLNVPPGNFQQGFPGITSRYEWFAIDYTGRFWIEQPGRYRFGLTSDDGSKLYLDSRLVIDNDGVHESSGCTANVDLARGIHSLRVSYFQGPRFQVSLILGVARPGAPWRIFDTRDFTPPSNSDAWTSNDAGQPKKQNGKVRRGNCWAQ